MSSSSAASSTAYHSQLDSSTAGSSSICSLSSAGLGEGPRSASICAPVEAAHDSSAACGESQTTTVMAQVDGGYGGEDEGASEAASRDFVVNLHRADNSGGGDIGPVEPQRQMEQRERAEVEVAEPFHGQDTGDALAAAREQTQIFSAYPCDDESANREYETAAAGEHLVLCNNDTPALDGGGVGVGEGEEFADQLQQGPGELPVETGRLERSNSCSQAERGSLARLLSARSSAQFLASSSQSIGSGSAAPQSTADGGGAVSASHENLLGPTGEARLLHNTDEAVEIDPLGPCDTSRQLGEPPAALVVTCHSRPGPHAPHDQEPQNTSLGQLSSVSCSPPRSRHFEAHPAPAAAVQQQPVAAKPAQSSSSSRFFSSKLNTGSLWSLLSVGSSTSMSAINEISSFDLTASEEQQQQAEAEAQPHDNSAGKQLRDFTSRSANFFNQFKSKSNSSNVQALSSSASFDRSGGQMRCRAGQQQDGATADQTAAELAQQRKNKYRFGVKYIGSAMLHKNFTLPMLEWIVKDIKRQTSRAGISQRQFTIPVREIMLEIQPTNQQLNAISCKDGHAIFVHPMHCVSKYAQIQHDPSAFAYIIRDSKEAPSFCHVFQAKSAHRVHEIFSAIREVTTRNQLCGLVTTPTVQPMGASHLKAANAGQSLTSGRLQKSASTDGHWRGLLSPPGAQKPQGGAQEHAQIGPAAEGRPAASRSPPVATTMNSSQAVVPQDQQQPAAAVANPACVPAAQLQAPAQGQQQQQQDQAQDDSLSLQFENSYQFEVMFVKRVKLQCRRVPPSFVDDALETLKTFEAPKTTQIKAGVTKRIISASVDERQEYDETCQSPTPGSGPAQDSSGLLKSGLQADEQRRGSSVSLKQQPVAAGLSPVRGGGGVGESKSCQQSPIKLISEGQSQDSRQHPQQQTTLNSCTNDFSPYNTITSSDLNERIAAIPVVSSSVLLDHETRQRLARQVRETIMATAANIKPEVGESEQPGAPGAAAEPAGPDAQAAARASPQAARRASASPSLSGRAKPDPQQQQQVTNNFDLFRRASARQVVKNRTMLLLIGKDELCAISTDKHQMLFSKSFTSIVHCLQGIKNKDHFGLICRDSGKINPQAESYAGFVFKCQSDKVVREIMGALKQVIYSSQHNYHTSYSPYNPLNFAGLGQSNIQSAFNASKQVSSSSSSSSSSQQARGQKAQAVQARVAAAQASPTRSAPAASPSAAERPKQPSEQAPVSLAAKRGFANPLELVDAAAGGAQRAHPPAPTTAPALQGPASGSAFSSLTVGSQSASQQHQHQQQAATAAKNPIKSMFCDDCPLYWYHRLCCDIESLPAEASKTIILRRIDSSLSEREQDEVFTKFSEFKIESIDEHNEIFMSILRHLSERKQLRHAQTQAHVSALAKNASLARKQSSDVTGLVQRQSSSSSSSTGGGGGGQHQAATAGSASSSNPMMSRGLSFIESSKLHFSASNHKRQATPGLTSELRGHQRSGSSSGSLASITGVGLGQQQQQQTNLAEAGSLAMDNLKRAKNSISVSIENMLKRRSSLRDESERDMELAQAIASAGGRGPLRTGSFKGTPAARSAAAGEVEASPSRASCADSPNQLTLGTTTIGLNNLKRSQSTSDYPQACGAAGEEPSQNANSRIPSASWRDSLTRTLNTEDLTNPLVGFFKRRGSLISAQDTNEQEPENRNHRTTTANRQVDSKMASTESLSSQTHEHATATGQHSPSRHQSIQAQLSARLMHLPGGGGNAHPNSTSQQRTSGQSSPSGLLSGSFWKKSIFDKIQRTSSPSQRQGGNEGRANEGQQQVQMEHKTKRTKQELRDLWKKAILEQITLLKMDKQNQKLLQTNSKHIKTSSGQRQELQTAQVEQLQSAHDNRGSSSGNNEIEEMKLNYKDVPFAREAPEAWARMLRQDPTKKVQFVDVARQVRLGIPKQCRGEAWMFLMNQYQLRHGTSFQPAENEFRGDANQTYRSLLSQLSTQQHEIFVDIGRTFPSHPYYSRYLSIGQLSLFNLLKAYSLLDPEVGYCQGLSFVAGILLLHVDSEDEAFELMRHLMFNFGLRKQYLPSMDALHLQLYQMTRLLRDHEFVIFDHFDQYDISPSLYAAPWFLTLFASQFPLGFVSRLLDLIFLIGIEAIFRTSLMLLAYHRTRILECTSLELTMDFMRTDLVKIDDQSLARIFDDALGLDLRNKLIEYEIEYSFYCADDKARAASSVPHHLQSLHHHHPNHHHHNAHYSISARHSANSSSSTVNLDMKRDHQQHDEVEELKHQQNEEPTPHQAEAGEPVASQSSSVGLTSEVADATATVIIQHLLANNHLKSLRTNYSY